MGGAPAKQLLQNDAATKKKVKFTKLSAAYYESPKRNVSPLFVIIQHCEVASAIAERCKESAFLLKERPNPRSGTFRHGRFACRR
jgi:hypothetical protein